MYKKVDVDGFTGGDLLNHVFDKSCKLQESINNQFLILHGVTDEGHLVLDENENVLASTPSEKISLVIDELIKLKEEAIVLENFENFIEEFRDELEKVYEKQK